MFVIEEGEVSVLKRGDQDELVEITVLGAGDIAGEMSLFGRPLRSATLRARGKTTIWTIDYDSFQDLLDQHPMLARGVLSCLSRYLSQENSLVARLLSQDTDRRFKVAFFDTKPYIKKVFEECNQFDYCLHFIDARLTQETVSLAAGHQAVCVFVNDTLDKMVIESLARLGIEVIALRCAGFNNVDIEACSQSGISVVRVPAYSPHAVAEHALALMLTLNRRVHRANTRVRESNFSLDGLVGFDMYGKTAGIIGAGKIGVCLLRILSGLGCNVLAYDKYPNHQLAQELGVSFVSLNELLEHSDIISLHAPLIPETHHMINEDAIKRMKPGVMVINTSRGALIDTKALLRGLKSGHIGYAGLDVYEEESGYFFEDFSDRVMTDDLLARLTTFNNVIVTSHQAFLTSDALTNIADTTLANLHEFELGKRADQLTNAVHS